MKRTGLAISLLLLASLLWTAVAPQQALQVSVAQNVDIDTSQPPVVVNSSSNLGTLSVHDGRIIIIRTGSASGLMYYSAGSSATVDDVDVINGPGGVGRYLRLAGGSGAAALVDVANKVADVTALLATSPSDNQLYQTLGYSTEGVGANLYRYDSASTATIDGVFTFPGPGGTLSFSGTTFNGDAGDGGRFVAVDQTVADVTKAGAVGDGTTDDTSAFNLASASGCKVVMVPASTFVVSSVNVVTSGQHWDIRGTIKQKVQSATVGPPIFDVLASDVTFAGTGTIDGDRDNQPADMLADAYDNGSGYGRSYRAGIEMNGSVTTRNGLTVDSLKFVNMFGACVATNVVSRVNVSNCTVDDSNFELVFSENQSGTPVTDYSFIDNTCRNITTGNTGAGVNGDTFLVVNVDRLTMDGNKAFGCARNLLKAETNLQNAVISGNVCEDATDSAGFHAFQFANAANNVTVTGNVATDYPGFLAWSSAAAVSSNVSITGNTFYGVDDGTASNDAIRVLGAVTGLTISDNEIRHFKRYGIYVASSTAGAKSFVSVSGNTISSTLGETAMLVSADGHNITDFSIEGNRIDMLSAVGNGTLAFSNVAPYRIYNLSVKGNIITADAISHRSFWASGAFTFAGTCVVDSNYFGGVFLSHGTLPSKTFTADSGTDVFTSTAHGFNDGDSIYATSTTTLPAGMTASRKYYIVASAANTFQLSLTSNGSAIDVTDAGTGTHTAFGILPMVTTQNNVIMGATQSPHRTTAAPVRPPVAIGEEVIDTTGGKLYMATGVTNATDFKVMN